MKPRNPMSLFVSRCRWAVLSLIAATAWAEPREIPKENSSPLSDWLSADGITGDWGGLRSKLADRGVVFLGTEQVEGWGNITGGLKQGTIYTGLLKLGLNLDLEKAVGWCGASLGTTWFWLSGRDASQDLAGNFLTISGTPDSTRCVFSNSGSSKICWTTKSRFASDSLRPIRNLLSRNTAPHSSMPPSAGPPL